MIESENTERKTRDTSEERKDLEIGISARHQALERILRDIKQMVSAEDQKIKDESVSPAGGKTAEGVSPSSPGMALHRAQELVYKAWETTGLKRAELAVQALEISEDCADAYIILGEETSKTPQEAIQMYQLAVRAGERALGPEAFRESIGEFWDLVDARPYMRALAKLAEALWDNGDHRRAIIHYNELLRLDSGDSQGIRYALVNCLLEEGLHQEVKGLMVEYRGDQTAAWLYSRALWAYVRFGKGMRAGSYLKEALRANGFVPEFLLSLRELPHSLPDYHGWGDENEAILYVHDALSTWKAIKGALDWLRDSAHLDRGESGL
jgi:tetratricopeptide (TPR) repeat protein